MKELGYHYVSIDLEGYRQGSLNESVKAIKPNWQSLKPVQQ
jgi:PP-loop superfamily ATP-utilizing enzyme